MAKPGPISAKPLSVLLSDVFSDAYAKQGFAARELVTRWADIAGPEVAAHSEPQQEPESRERCHRRRRAASQFSLPSHRKSDRASQVL